MTEAEFKFKWETTHIIEKIFHKKRGMKVNLYQLGKNQSVACGDGKTFYYLLTKKE